MGRHELTDRQWARACSLLIGSASDGLDLSNLRIKFATHKGDLETPNSAEITVYNLSDETVSRIRGEFKRVVLSAGYEDAAAVIFDGQIRQVRSGRDAADSWLEIILTDGDRAYNYAVVNQTLAAGSTPLERVSAGSTAMAAKGTPTGICRVRNCQEARSCMAWPAKSCAIRHGNPMSPSRSRTIRCSSCRPADICRAKP